MQYYDWQRRCLDAWVQNGCRGTINVVTGAGKTVFAFLALQYLQSVTSSERLRVKIVVPQVFLLHQWVAELRARLGLESEELGVFYGGHKDIAPRRVTIYVVNSARYALARHILSDLEQGYGVFLIADECHRYVSEQNAKIFDFADKISLANASFYSLGLSATPRTSVNVQSDATLGREVFRYRVVDATRDQVISRCAIINIALDFTAEEYEAYQELSNKLTLNIAQLSRLCPELRRLHKAAFFVKLKSLCFDKNLGVADLSEAVLVLMYMRRSLVYLAASRTDCTLSLIARLEPEAKIILFCERIETADLLYLKLRETIPNQVGIYHSKRDRLASRDVLERYRENAIRVLISCRALDEGLNIPDADVGIIVSSTSSARQRTQRLGRILRRSQRIKRLYYFHVRQSNEDASLLDREQLAEQTPTLEMQFRDGEFSSYAYDELCTRVFKYVSARRGDAGLAAILLQNMDLGLARYDWCGGEMACRERIAQATSLEERNYWITMLYLALAWERKLA